MNRKQRRAAERIERRDAANYAAYIVRRDSERNARKAKLERNGITIADLDKAIKDGYEEGYKIAGYDTIKACYAATCLALKRLHGFGKLRCSRVLRAIDDIVLYRLTGEDLIQQVWDEIGLTLDFDAALNRLEDV